MKLVFAHARWMILELIRQPAYIVSSVAFPALFYVIFAIPESKDTDSANFLLASFSGFAVFGVVFLQFGIGIAQDRTRTWHYFLRTLPVKTWQMLTARLISSLVVSVLAAGGIVALALAFTPAELSAKTWLHFSFALMAPSLVFCFMGLALGYWTSEKSSLPVGNLLYLPLSFAGGLWKPPSILPESLKTVSEYLPTRHYGELLWAVVSEKSYNSDYIFTLSGYALAFAVLALWGFRRDLEKRLT